MSALVMSVVTLTLFAQTDFRPGYIVKTGGDTLKGEIDYRGDILMSEICKFRSVQTSKEKVYTPDDITSFRFSSGKYFVTKKVGEKNIFLQFLLEGKVNLYYYRDQIKDHYFIEKDGLGLSELPYNEQANYANNEEYHNNSVQHIGILKYYMQDAPAIQSRIEKLTVPKQKWLIDLAREYHSEVCPGRECLVYTREVHTFKMSLEPLAGIVFYNGNYFDGLVFYLNGKFKGTSYFTGGVIANISLQTVNEKLYIRTGVLLSRFNTFSTQEPVKTYAMIPLQVEYIYPRGVFRPKAYCGLTMNQPFYLFANIGTGAYVRINKTVSWSFDIAADFDTSRQMPLLPEKFLGVKLLTGLNISL
jgi:hypothetical protein